MPRAAARPQQQYQVPATRACTRPPAASARASHEARGGTLRVRLTQLAPSRQTLMEASPRQIGPGQSLSRAASQLVAPTSPAVRSMAAVDESEKRAAVAARSPRQDGPDQSLSRSPAVTASPAVPQRADVSALMQDFATSRLADVDTGVRMHETEGADTVLLEMPRGSPAEICVRINPGDRVLGSPSLSRCPCLASHSPVPAAPCGGRSRPARSGLKAARVVQG